MGRETVDWVISEIISRGLADPRAMEGCTEEEIQEIQRSNEEIKLPEDYIYFMKRAGREPLDYFSIELTLGAALYSRESAEEISEEFPEFDTSDKLFIGEFGNEVVFYFKKGSTGVFRFYNKEEKRGDSFSEFLCNALEMVTRRLESAKKLEQRMEQRRSERKGDQK